MGGQACVFYGAAEFSRDTDLAILASSENLAKLDKALTDLDARVIANRENPKPEQVRFWFMELRTPEILIELAVGRGRLTPQLLRKRPLLRFAQAKHESLLVDALVEEEKRERAIDQQFWAPLKKELEMLGHSRVRT